MTISNAESNDIFVWIWLPDETQPVVAGKLTQAEGRVLFTYGQSYLNRSNAISIYSKELPLTRGSHEGFMLEALPSCIRDASPDAWGRRVILHKLTGAKGREADTYDLDEFIYLLESGSDRIGALDFQKSSDIYEPRIGDTASLEELSQAAELIEKGVPLNAELAEAIQHGTAIGGARPKVLIRDGEAKYIAKFSLSTDLYNMIKAEFIAMKLAELCGLQAAQVKLTKAGGKDLLLIKRFDREYKNGDWVRKLMVSGLTILSLGEMTARYASYEKFAEIIRNDFTHPKQTLKEMFARLVFNILSCNTDDHPRNHAAFWDGRQLSLTPAYDITPQLRAGGEATQAMKIVGDNNFSRLTGCLATAKNFLLNETRARHIIDAQIATINANWDRVCEEARLSPVENEMFKTRLFLHPYALTDYE